MRQFLSKLLTLCLPVLLASAMANAAEVRVATPEISVVAAHRLDGLTVDEISKVVQILRGNKLTDDKRFFPLIELSEPLKADALAWRQGSPLTRAAYVNFKVLHPIQPSAFAAFNLRRLLPIKPVRGAPWAYRSRHYF